MSYQDRDWAAQDNPMDRFGRPGGDFQGIRPSMDNPMTWSLPLGRVAGILIRVHIIFLIFIVIRLLSAAGSTGALGFWFEATLLGSLFTIVLLHEFGHCFACRLVGGHANEILMWPLGGLAFCQPPLSWRAHLITAAGGPVVNVVICLILGPTLYVFSGEVWGVAVPRFLDISYGLSYLGGSWWLTMVYLANWVSLMLLLFNLLPIFPLDGGRIVQALLWPRAGYARSMRFAVWTGYLGAIGLGIVGFVIPVVTLVLIAVFGGITCYITSRQLSFTDDFMGYQGSEYETYHHDEPARSTRQERRAAKQAVRDRSDEDRVERILSKIADTGMDSLSGAERRLLQRATERKQESS